MTGNEMKLRTKVYANRVEKICSALPPNWVAQTPGRQRLRCGTSVGANYRAVSRAKSNSDFINKLRLVEEKCDESLFRMEWLVDNDLLKAARLSGLIQAAGEILQSLSPLQRPLALQAARKS